jgi:hypothetical protein
MMERYTAARSYSRMFWYLLATFACTCGAYMAALFTESMLAESPLFIAIATRPPEPFSLKQVSVLFNPPRAITWARDLVTAVICIGVLAGLARRPLIVIYHACWDDDL